MKLIHENKFSLCKTSKDLYTNMDRLGILQGITIDQRKLLSYLCEQIDKYGAANPVEIDIASFSEDCNLPGLSVSIVLTMGAMLAQRFFWLRRPSGAISQVRIFTKIQNIDTTVRFHFDEELLSLRKQP